MRTMLAAVWSPPGMRRGRPLEDVPSLAEAAEVTSMAIADVLATVLELELASARCWCGVLGCSCFGVRARGGGVHGLRKSKGARVGLLLGGGGAAAAAAAAASSAVASIPLLLPLSLQSHGWRIELLRPPSPWAPEIC